MTYKELAGQYFAQYLQLSFYVKQLKIQLQKNATECSENLNRRIRLLYAICLELKHTSEHLKYCERRELCTKNE